MVDPIRIESPTTGDVTLLVTDIATVQDRLDHKRPDRVLLVGRERATLEGCPGPSVAVWMPCAPVCVFECPSKAAALSLCELVRKDTRKPRRELQLPPSRASYYRRTSAEARREDRANGWFPPAARAAWFVYVRVLLGNLQWKVRELAAQIAGAVEVEQPVTPAMRTSRALGVFPGGVYALQALQCTPAHQQGTDCDKEYVFAAQSRAESVTEEDTWARFGLRYMAVHVVREGRTDGHARYHTSTGITCTNQVGKLVPDLTTSKSPSTVPLGPQSWCASVGAKGADLVFFFSECDQVRAECSQQHGTVLSRVACEPLRAPPKGQTRSGTIPCTGRVVVDLALLVQQRHPRLPAYDWNTVRRHLLPGDDPRQTPETLVRLAELLSAVVVTIETAAVSRIRPVDVWGRGPSHRGYANLFFCKTPGTVLNESVIPASIRDGTYTGGLTLQTQPGLHDNVATLDFVGMYPSIMQAYGLCWTTLVVRSVDGVAVAPEGTTDGVQTFECTVEIMQRSPNANSKRRRVVELAFVQVGQNPSQVYLRHLSSTRAHQKRLRDACLAAGGRAGQASVHDARQLACKLEANSLYGLSGQAGGKYPCNLLAAAVCQLGRGLLRRVATHFQATCPFAEVIGGVTDSVFVKFRPTPAVRLDAFWEACVAASAQITNQIGKFPVCLQAEKLAVRSCYLGNNHQYLFLADGKQEFRGGPSRCRDVPPVVQRAVVCFVEAAVRDQRTDEEILRVFEEVLSTVVAREAGCADSFPPPLPLSDFAYSVGREAKTKIARALARETQAPPRSCAGAGAGAGAVADRVLYVMTRSSTGTSVAQALPTPSARSTTPTCAALDRDHYFQVIGAYVEKVACLHSDRLVRAVSDCIARVRAETTQPQHMRRSRSRALVRLRTRTPAPDVVTVPGGGGGGGVCGRSRRRSSSSSSSSSSRDRFAKLVRRTARHSAPTHLT